MVAHHVLVVMSKGFNNIFETLHFEKIVSLQSACTNIELEVQICKGIKVTRNLHLGHVHVQVHNYYTHIT